MIPPYMQPVEHAPPAQSAIHRYVDAPVIREPAYMRGSIKPFVPGSLAEDADLVSTGLNIAHKTKGTVRTSRDRVLHAEVSSLFARYQSTTSAGPNPAVERSEFDFSSVQDLDLLDYKELYPSDEDDRDPHYKVVDESELV